MLNMMAKNVSETSPYGSLYTWKAYSCGTPHFCSWNKIWMRKILHINGELGEECSDNRGNHVPKSTKRCQKVPRGGKKYQKVPKSSHKIWIVDFSHLRGKHVPPPLLPAPPQLRVLEALIILHETDTNLRYKWVLMMIMHETVNKDEKD